MRGFSSKLQIEQVVIETILYYNVTHHAAKMRYGFYQ